MSMLQDTIVQAFQLLIFGMAHVLGGSLPLGLLASTALARVALLPLTRRVAERRRLHARRVRDLAPDLEKIADRFRDDPRARWDAVRALYRERGVTSFDVGGLVPVLAAMPVSLARFSAVYRTLPLLRSERFLWIRDLARPDLGLAVLVAGGMAVTAAMAGPGAEQAAWVRWLPAASALVVLLFASSGFGLYMLGNVGVGVADQLIRRLPRRG
jgi:membrane protein insertase Oxa1/YidC/SpoIIIJ